MGAAIARVCVSLMYRSGAGRAPVAAARRAAPRARWVPLVALRDAQPVGDVRRVEVAPRLVAEQAERHGVRTRTPPTTAYARSNLRSARRNGARAPSPRRRRERARARAGHEREVDARRPAVALAQRARALSRKKLFARPRRSRRAGRRAGRRGRRAGSSARRRRRGSPSPREVSHTGGRRREREGGGSPILRIDPGESARRARRARARGEVWRGRATAHTHRALNRRRRRGGGAAAERAEEALEAGRRPVGARRPSGASGSKSLCAARAGRARRGRREPCGSVAVRRGEERTNARARAPSK